MLAITSTENLTGAHISGDYWDLDELLTAIKTVIGERNHYLDYEAARERLLQFCIQLRNGIDGEKHIEFIANGINDGILKRHELLAPKKNIYYAIDCLIPEVAFVALALNDFISLYTKRAQLLLDPAIATIRKFQMSITSFLKEVLDEQSYVQFEQQFQQQQPVFFRYATQFVDVLNIEYLKLTKEERAQRMAQFILSYTANNPSYNALKQQLLQVTSTSKQALHELPLKIEYPETIIW